MKLCNYAEKCSAWGWRLLTQLLEYEYRSTEYHNHSSIRCEQHHMQTIWQRSISITLHNIFFDRNSCRKFNAKPDQSNFSKWSGNIVWKFTNLVWEHTYKQEIEITMETWYMEVIQMVFLFFSNPWEGVLLVVSAMRGSSSHAMKMSFDDLMGYEPQT